ncbi:uncharacterized protein LOC122004780 [Zingiber officinale]|uniref:uncharacterized protein LOC122004780 n=1 Tax=Zingiber officinale TaxID=94328 RepID=UPI001C4C68D7|nr:uncharacterized protein LOC122004780 [Zingiber officinale]
MGFVGCDKQLLCNCNCHSPLLTVGKRRADSTPHSTPPPPAGKLEVEEPLYEKRAVYNNVLGEPEPLGLRLRKTPSIQMMLSQSKAGKNLCVTSSKGSKVGVKSNFLASSSSLSKIKASLFHASLLRVGTWKFVTRYEGDLVAKCYFAKCKLLWEFLESGLKSKIEFHWSDITAIKAVFFDGGHGALDIVLARPPLFFREIDPQPRKHIQWQATQDFTNGQAHIHRGHILQCPQTSLSKNFEKLINCDPHLKLFSQQPDIILESPYFDPLLNQQPDIILESPYFAPLLSQQPDIILESPYFDPLLSQQPDIILESPYFDPQYSDIILASPYIDPQYSVLEVSLVQHHQSPIRRKHKILSGGHLLLIQNTLLHRAQPPSAASDDQSIIPKVNSLCYLLQQDTVASTMVNAQVNDQDGSVDDAEAGIGSYDEPYSTQEVELSFLELMMIPRIASFPRILSQSYLT